MKVTLEKAMSELRTQEDKKYFVDFISKYASREERHYCAYLFSWLISSPEALKKYFENHSQKDLLLKLTSKDFILAKIYFEYTSIRELIDLIGRKVKSNLSDELKANLKSEIESEIFGDTKQDIQKKKPDLVFYFPDSKTLVLVEAKFEMGFDIDQIDESKKYGDVLMTLFPEDIASVYVTALGLNYYVSKIEKQCPAISWEALCNIVPDGKIKEEIKQGLIYQQVIHPKAMIDFKL